MSGEPSYDLCVSTRKLILTAIACGLAILLSGGVFLVRTARHRDELTITNAAVGDTRMVSGVSAAVQSWRRDSDQIVATIHIEVPPSGQSISSADAPWTMLVGTKLTAVPPTGLRTDETACRGLAVPPGGKATCVLAFAGVAGSPFLAFAVNGAQEQWRLAP